MSISHWSSDWCSSDIFAAAWEPRLATAPIEVQIFGDLETVDYKKILAETLGALPPRKVLAPPRGQQVAFAKHVTEPDIAYHRGHPAQAAAITAWPTRAGLASPRAPPRTGIWWIRGTVLYDLQIHVTLLPFK